MYGGCIDTTKKATEVRKRQMEKARGKGEWWKQAQRGGRDQCRQRYSATKICLVKKYKRSRALLQTNYSLLTLGSGGHKEVAPAVAHGDQNLGELIVAEIFEAERLRQLEAAAQPCVAVPEQRHHLTLVACRQNERKQINPASTRGEGERERESSDVVVQSNVQEGVRREGEAPGEARQGGLSRRFNRYSTCI